MTNVRLSGAVMAHPRRTEPGQALIRSTRPGFLALVLDPEPDGPPTALRTAMRAWSSIPPASTHHVVLEDDAELCPGFVEHAERAAAAAPDAAIVFHANWSSRNGAALRLGALAGGRWVRAADEYTPTVALLLPATVGAGFAAYARRHGGSWAGDVVMSRYLKSIGVPTYVTVPNLVEHGDHPSVADNDFHGLRLSACYADLPAHADWSLDHVLQPDVVPLFKFGMALCAIRQGPMGRWLTVGSDRCLRRLGMDVGGCLESLASALSSAPDTTRALDARLSRAVVESLWRTAYVMGFVSRRPERFPDLGAELVAWSADPLVDEVITTVGAGGLCMSLSSAELVRLAEPLRYVVQAALIAGARRRGSARTGPARAGAGRIVLVAPKGQAPRRCLAAGPSDRG